MERQSSLDGLRALAAILVVAFHSFLPFFKGGFIGVDIFFVLSGFLITTILVDENDRNGKIAIVRFWGRRMARLYPAMALVLVAFLLVAPILFKESSPLREIVLTGLYLSDYGVAFWGEPTILRHMWSLAVEAHFYFIWPFAVMLMCLLGRQRAVVLLILLYVAATCWRALVYDTEGWMRAYYAFDTHATGLILGSFFALLPWRPQGVVADKYGAVALSVILFFVSLLSFYSVAAAGLCAVLVEVSAGFLILAVLSPSSQIGAMFSHPVLVRLGLWSYGLYLWHYPIAGLARVTFSGTVSFLVTITISLILAGLSYELFEKRTTRWLQARYFATRRPSITADRPVEATETATASSEPNRLL